MESLEMKKIKECLNREISLIVEKLFQSLKENDIDVEKGRDELTQSELEKYLRIYNEYEQNLIQLRKNMILKFGEFKDFDYIFATVIQEVVTNTNNRI